MRSIPIEKMKAATGLPPLRERWESEVLMQYIKAEIIKSHSIRIRTATKSLWKTREKQLHYRQLQKSIQEQFPREVTLTLTDSGRPG
jgi:hypothetical protein